MRIGPPTPPSVPPHIAAAYGLSSTGPSARATKTAPARQAPPAPAEVQRIPEKAARLIAAVVPGGIDFSAEEPVPSAPTLPMHRHPAELNAAATGVALGRTLDVTA